MKLTKALGSIGGLTLASRVLALVRDALLLHGLLTGTFLVLYGASRTLIELFREPDAELILGATRGQVYSLPMVLIGAALIASAAHRRRIVAAG